MNPNHFVNHPKASAFHSSGYAKVANGASIGSTDSQTFGQRIGIDRRRQTVRRYGDSLIGRGHMKEVAQTEIETSNPLRQGRPQITSRQQLNTRGGATRPTGIRPSIPPRTFVEPPTRRFNPFG